MAFQERINAKIATVVRAGFAIGMTSLEKMVNSPAPSILAASEISWGIPVKNWRSRKMKNGFPKKQVTVRGRKVPIHFIFVNIRNRGTSVT